MGDKKSSTGFKIRNVLEALIVSIVLIVGVSSAIVVLTTGPEDSVQFIIGNETYIADETTNFNSITIDSSHIIFNNTGFYLTAPNDITITLVYINDNVAGADDADKIVEFLADTSGGNVLFDLSGFPAGNNYVVKRDGESFSYPTADSSGYISFSSIVDGDKRFEILQVGDGVENNPPYTPSNPNPANQNTNANLDVILSWSGGDPDGDPVTYDVYFGTASQPPQVSSGQSATNYDPGTLDYDITYYWKIVAWDDKGASTVGPVWEFTTEEEPNTPPYEPSNPSPSDGATDEYVNIDISWVGSDPDGDPVTYDVYFGTVTPPPQVSWNQPASTYNPGVMDYETTYYWKIVAWDDKDASTVGPVWEFTTEEEPNTPPYEPSNPSPSDGATDANVNIDLSWTGGDPDGDPVTYDVFFGTASQPPQVSWNQPASTYNPGVMDYETTYYWKIVAWDDKGASTVGPVWEFTTEEEPNTPPYEPNNPSPSDGATDEYVNIDISWVGGDPDGDPVTYDVYFGTASDPPQVSSGQSATTYDPGTLDYNDIYYWKIVAWDDKDASTVGPVWEFTTGSMQDTIPPEISDLGILFSDPIDTQIDFGWENFTCIVTDNVDVDDVFLNIIYPDSTTTDVSMINIAGTNQYYYNTSFSEHGNYGYFIWADDTSNNTDISSNYEFSVSPNWDVNQDGVCDANDNSLVSSHYGETGAPGWIREDVDNNGQIQVFDLVLISINYGETW